MREKEPQKPPEHTLEHVKSQNFLGACLQTPLTQYGPHFLYLPWSSWQPWPQFSSGIFLVVNCNFPGCHHHFHIKSSVINTFVIANGGAHLSVIAMKTCSCSWHFGLFFLACYRQNNQVPLFFIWTFGNGERTPSSPILLYGGSGSAPGSIPTEHYFLVQKRYSTALITSVQSP